MKTEQNRSHALVKMKIKTQNPTSMHLNWMRTIQRPFMCVKTIVKKNFYLNVTKFNLQLQKQWYFHFSNEKYQIIICPKRKKKKNEAHARLQFNVCNYLPKNWNAYKWPQVWIWLQFFFCSFTIQSTLTMICFFHFFNSQRKL